MKCTLPTLLLAMFVAIPAFADTAKHDFKGAATAEVYKEASGDDLWIYRFDPDGHDPKKDKRAAVAGMVGQSRSSNSIPDIWHREEWLPLWPTIE